MYTRKPETYTRTVNYWAMWRIDLLKLQASYLGGSPGTEFGTATNIYGFMHVLIYLKVYKENDEKKINNLCNLHKSKHLVLLLPIFNVLEVSHCTVLYNTPTSKELSVSFANNLFIYQISTLPMSPKPGRYFSCTRCLPLRYGRISIF